MAASTRRTEETSVASGHQGPHRGWTGRAPRPTRNLPADAGGQSIWKVIFKGAKGLARTNDVIVDGNGDRYQVISADWGPLVTTSRCQILQS